MKSDKIFDSYVAYELLYETKMREKYKDVPLFPDNWYAIRNYKSKIDILIDAIDNNVLIINTKKYKELIINKKKCEM